MSVYHRKSVKSLPFPALELLGPAKLIYFLPPHGYLPGLIDTGGYIFYNVTHPVDKGNHHRQRKFAQKMSNSNKTQSLNENQLIKSINHYLGKAQK
jgi:hypothetical protein